MNSSSILVAMAATRGEPDDVLSSAGYLLMKAGHYIGVEIEAALAGLGLTAREFLVLSFVRSHDELSQQQLSERLTLDPTLVVGLLDSLEQRGLLTRRKAPTDRRRNVLGLTAAGRGVHDRAAAAARATEQAFLADLSAPGRREFRRALTTILAERLPWLTRPAS